MSKKRVELRKKPNRRHKGNYNKLQQTVGGEFPKEGIVYNVKAICEGK